MTKLTLADCRPEVLAFALLMEAQLRANDHKPGWKDDRPLDLAWRVREEAMELFDIVLDARNRTAEQLEAPGRHGLKSIRERIGSEAADVANMAMMTADVSGALPPVGAEYVVWSNEHRAWWGPDHRGYYTKLAAAGRYSREEALKICIGARGGRQFNHNPSEVPLALEDAQRFWPDDQPEWEKARRAFDTRHEDDDAAEGSA